MKNRNLMVTIGDWYYGTNPYKVLNEINKSQYFTTEQLEVLQLEYLKKIVKHTIEHVPFYRDYFTGQNIVINSLADINKFPFIDKKIINQNYNAFVADNAKKPYMMAKTTGSSGVPFCFIKARIAENYKIASRLRAKNWFGIGRCEKALKISGVPPVNMGLKAKMIEHLRFLATKRNEMFISDMINVKIPLLLKQYQESKPDAIIGLAGGVALLAIKFKGKISHFPKAIFTNSESITPLQRKQIYDCFGVEPRSDYAATEGSIAHECELGGMHMDMEECFAEIINEDNNGIGDLVLTFLHSYDMPLIRYKIGDKARWCKDKCKCGRGLKLIDDVLGRETDVIKLPNGQEYSSANINYVPSNLKNVENLAEYQLIQTKMDEVVVKIVLINEEDTAVVDEMRNELSKLLIGIHLKIEICNTLVHGAGGKLRIVVALKS